MPIERIAILGTGLIGSSVGMALRRNNFRGTIFGWDRDPAQTTIALSRGAIDVAAQEPLSAAVECDVILLSGPVFSILDWLEQLAALLKPEQLVTDVGSVKGVLCDRAQGRYNQPDKPGFLPGHPMAGKEVSGAAHADGDLFRNAVWLFTECEANDSMSAGAREKATEWRAWVQKFGSRILEIQPARHDELCAWVSHLPQFVSTALSALLEDTFPHDEELRAIGGRALREMTRLGASPYSMWRDIAHTNTDAVAASLLALEQRLTHLREHLKTPELREEFDLANRFRLGSR
ncbi:MAG TPA: prephenate dehydrogenase/arogenate dehydrogenase family protein [Alloacidobacterium sp.]|nr:prephenate dehydrogenase/arogenate dehydrogenase family protein [Alloacidobacterium sp.]